MSEDIPQKCCSACEKWFPATTAFFHRRIGKKDGLRNPCRACLKLPRSQRPKFAIPVPDGYKRCSVCHVDFPATLEFFPYERSTKDGLRGRCKECYSERDRKLHPEMRTVKKLAPTPPGQKRCSACELPFPATGEFFYRNAKAKDGFNPWCKTCRRVYDRQRMAKPEIHERKSTYYKSWLEAHRDQVKSYYGSYYKRNREKFEAHYHTRRARSRAVQGIHTAVQIRDMLKRHKYRCYWCNVKLKENKAKAYGYEFHKDHTFPLSRVAGTDIPANDISYIVPACPDCNQKRYNKFPWEFPEGGRLL